MARDPEEWTRILVKKSTRDRIQKESEKTGMKMYALIDRAFPEEVGEAQA